MTVKYFKIQDDSFDPQNHGDEAIPAFVYTQIEHEFTRQEYDDFVKQDFKSENDKMASNRNLLIFNDKSYSMSGKPFDTLKVAHQNIGKMIFDDDGNSIFKEINVIFYNVAIDARRNIQSRNELEQFVKGQTASDRTDFCICFEEITKSLTKPNSEYFIVFFTDGQDTKNKR